MPPEMKREVLDLIDRVRQAIEQDKQEEMQALMVEGFSMIIQIVGKDSGLLPVVIMEMLP